MIGAGATWYQDHYGSVATVNGVTISRDDYRTRFTIEQFRLDQAENRLRDEFVAKRISQAQLDSGVQAIANQKSALSTLTQQRLIDTELQRQLAPSMAVTVSDQEVEDRLTNEAVLPAERHAWVIEVRPEVSTGATEATPEQVATAKATADKALADLKAGKDWTDIAKGVSTASSAAQGGDIGWITSNSTIDEPFITALFAATVNQPTAVIKGDDGTFRIGRVTETLDARTDATFTDKIANAGIAMTDYRKVVASDVLRVKLSDAVTASVTDTATTQRQVSEIYIAASQYAGDEVKVDHILFSPNGITDQQQLASIPPTDPSWDAAKQKAQAAYDELKPYIGTTQLQAKFTELAKAESNEPGADTSGGALPYMARDQLDRQFGDAVFANGLKQGDLIGPVQSAYGWHVILFQDRRPDPQSRIDAAKLRAESGEDFAAIAKEVSEGPDQATGGDMGWVAKYQLSSDKEAAIFATPVGKTSDPLEVPNDGFYLFKVDQEQSRKPDGDQLKTLKASAFTNWYTAQKAAAEIDDQSQASALPSS